MRLILVDDAALIRDGLARLLVDEGHEVVATFPDGDGVLEAVEELRPDVLVISITCGILNGASRPRRLLRISSARPTALASPPRGTTTARIRLPISGSGAGTTQASATEG